MKLPFLSLRPGIRREGDGLVVRTPLLVRLLSLGLCSRRFVFDRRLRTATLHRRLLWIIPLSRRIPFRDIARVEYDYEDVNPLSALARTWDAVDCFSIRLRLKDDDVVPVAVFVGEGHFVNDSHLPDWFFHRELRLDLAGTQESDSRMLYTVIEQMVAQPEPEATSTLLYA